MDQQDLLVLGDGLFSNLFIYFFQKKFPQKKILQVYAGDLAPPISEISTAVVALRNVSKGVSPLGDHLYDGFNLFTQFYEEFEGEGIEQCLHQNLCEKSRDKSGQFMRRFPKASEKSNFLFFEEKAFLISPVVFLNSLRSSNKQGNLIRKRDFIHSLSAKTAQGKNSEYCGEKLVLGLGPHWAIFNDLIPTPVPLKNVRGSYLSFPFRAEKSFSYTLNGHNLIYKNHSRELIFGNSQFEGEIHSDDYQKLITEYQNLVGALNFSHAPDVETANYISGIRDKAPKRMPFWGQSKEGPYFATGFWKNGYTLALVAVKEILESFSRNE